MSHTRILTHHLLMTKKTQRIHKILKTKKCNRNNLKKYLTCQCHSLKASRVEIQLIFRTPSKVRCQLEKNMVIRFKSQNPCACRRIEIVDRSQCKF